MRTRALVVMTLAAGLAGCQGEGKGKGTALTSTAIELPALAATAQSADPAVVVDPSSGDLLMTWVGGDANAWTLYFARSSDAGRSWSPAMPVAGGPAAPGEVHPHAESSPKLVAGPRGMLGVVWPNRIVVPGRKWPAAMMRFARSADGGKTWTPAITLNDDTTGTPTGHQFHGAALTGDSGLVVAWLDERGRPEHSSDATIFLVSSPDFGATWGANTQAWGAVCPCCKIALARRPDGEITATWRGHFPGDVRDIVTANLTPSATESKRVHADNWVYPGCPHTGPAIATGTDNVSHIIWYTGKPDGAGIFYAQVDSMGTTRHRVPLISGGTLPPTHASIVALPDGGALVAYDLGRDAARVISVTRMARDGTPLTTQELPASADGKYPQLTLLGDTAAVVAWTSAAGEKSQVRAARIAL